MHQDGLYFLTTGKFLRLYLRIPGQFCQLPKIFPDPHEMLPDLFAVFCRFTMVTTPDQVISHTDEVPDDLINLHGFFRVQIPIAKTFIDKVKACPVNFIFKFPDACHS